MFTESKLLNQFLKFLVKKGYPPKSINTKFPLSKTCWADVAILNPVTTQLLALVEVKYVRPSDKEKALLVERLRSYGQTGVLVFLVYPSAHMAGFSLECLDVAQDVFQAYDVQLFPSFPTLCDAGFDKYVVLKRYSVHQENKLFDRLVFWWMIVSTVLFFSELYGWLFPLTNTQLILLGGTMGLSFFPVLRRIKILGIELERIMPSNDKR